MGLNWIEFHLANQLLAVYPPTVNLEVNFSFNSFHGPISCASYQSLASPSNIFTNSCDFLLSFKSSWMNQSDTFNKCTSGSSSWDLLNLGGGLTNYFNNVPVISSGSLLWSPLAASAALASPTSSCNLLICLFISPSSMTFSSTICVNLADSVWACALSSFNLSLCY